MRTQKSIINSIINVLSYLIIFIPNLIIRNIFLEKLGSDLLGLNSLYSNIIGWLSIIEMGVGLTIIYSLYKPFFNQEFDKIRAYIKFYKNFYRKIGFIILIVGLCISPFVIYLINGEMNSNIVTVGFILFLLNCFLSYMFSYNICILNVAQESYKVTIATTLSKLIIFLLQVILLNYYPNFLLFICIQIIVNLLYFLLINKYILYKYSWLKEKQDYSLNIDEKNNLLKNVKAMFMHKIGSLVVGSTDNIIISKFIGLAAITKYTNYQIVITACQTIFINGLNGLTPSIGNMLVSGNQDKAYTVHKRIFFLNFWIASFLVICLYNTLDQFIILWVGQKYLLDELTLNIILINVYFGLMRGSVEQFQNGSGIFYYDRYAPICEAIINFIVSIILVKKIGLPGVFIGTLASNILVVFWSKPYIVYKYIFNKPLRDYFFNYFKYLLIGVFTLLLTHQFTSYFKNIPNTSNFFINCLLNILIINLVYLIVFYRADEFKYCIKLSEKIFKKINLFLNIFK